MGPVNIEATVENESLSGTAWDVLSTVRPHWKKARIQVKILTEGITNRLIRYHDIENPSDKLLIRIYGEDTELFIDRKSERKTMELLFKFNLGPELFAAFSNGLCYHFVDGETLTIESVRDPKLFRLIAREMARLHSIPLNETGEDREETAAPTRSYLFDRLSELLKNCPDHFDDPVVDERFKKICPSKKRITEEVECLKNYLDSISSRLPLAFSHNDLLLANVVHSPEQEKVTFIDYEYASTNYAAYDIGNHFTEWAGIDPLDFNLYPDKSTQLTWIRHYLEGIKEFSSPSSPIAASLPGAAITDEDLETWHIAVSKCSLGCNLFWGIWALLQTKFSSIDFDFLGYSQLKFQRYFDTKEEFMNL